MTTRIIKIDPLNIAPGLIREAAEVIKNRGLVAFPTETVYGLGADALDPKAVTGIFQAKQRPLDDPLIVHIARMEDLTELSAGMSPEAEKLVNLLWPGPLTVILKKTDKVPDLVTTGLETVAVRMPSSPVARELILAAGTPLAAPSANMFGRPSPTTAQHVIDDLDGRIDMVLDGGKTEIGVESTVIEFADGRIYVLRPGGVDLEKIRSIVGDVPVEFDAARAGTSPGKYPQHYSPRADVVIAEEGSGQTEAVLDAVRGAECLGLKAGVMAKQEHEYVYRNLHVKVLGPGDDGRICASRLFHLFREFDAEGTDIIVAEAVSEDGLGLAVMNRLRKAAGPEGHGQLRA